MPTPQKNLARREYWKILRTKEGSTDDDDWVGDNEVTEGVQLVATPVIANTKYGVETDVAIAVYAVDASGDIVYGSTTSMTLAGIEVIDRAHPITGAGVGAVSGVQTTAELATVPLQTVVLIPSNGAQQFTVRITDVANAPVGVDSYQVWYREYVQ